MVQFVLCGHGTFGSSLKNSLEMLLPEIQGITAIDFHKTMDTADLTEEIQNVINKHKEKPLLFICDIVGGAPFKVCALESTNHDTIRVIAGTNLSSLLEVYFQRYQEIDDIIQTMIRITKESIDYFPKKTL